MKKSLAVFLRVFLSITTIVVFVTFISGCQKEDGAMEKAGEKISEGAEKVDKAVKKAAEKVEEKVKK